MRRLAALGIPYEVTPGVPAYAAAAAALERELTLPGVSQTVILTRTSTRSSPMPEGEELAALARSGATLAIHLSIRSIAAATSRRRCARSGSGAPPSSSSAASSLPTRSTRAPFTTPRTTTSSAPGRSSGHPEPRSGTRSLAGASSMTRTLRRNVSAH